MNTTIKNGNIVTADGVIHGGALTVSDGKILSLGTDIPLTGEVYDAGGNYILPGYIDIHTHADGDTFFYEDPEKAARTLIEHGVTSVFPALYFSADKNELLRQIKLMRDAMNSGKAPNIAGLYMEAPYLNPKYGCDRENNPWTGDISPEDYMPIVDAAADIAGVWCVAPERPGIEKFCGYVKEKNHRAVFSVAHSEATPEQVEALIPCGLRLATHHTNATGAIPKYPECRPVGVDDAVWYNDCIYAEIICDIMGIHVNPYLQRLIRKIKGDDRIILISDSFVANGPVPPGYDGADDINFDFAGEIAGTRLTLDRACRNFMKHTGAGIDTVSRFASLNPAAMLGRGDIGRLCPGCRADIVVSDDRGFVQRVMKNGSWV